MKRELSVAVAALTIGCVGYFWWAQWSAASPAVWIASSLGVAAAVLGALIPASRGRAHAAIAAGLMLAVTGFATTRVVGRWPFAWDALPDARYAGFIAVSCLVVAVGLVRGALWARWAGMAFAAGNVLGGGLNSIHMWGERSESAWLAAIGVVGGLILLSELGGAGVRDHFARHARHAVWASRDRLVWSARWAAIASFAAAPMLLLYALGQPVAGQTVVSALVIAPVLCIGGVLVVARRAAGVLVLAFGGIALVAHTAASVSYVAAASLPIVGYYAAFWLPAAVLGIVAGTLAIARART